MKTDTVPKNQHISERAQTAGMDGFLTAPVLRRSVHYETRKISRVPSVKRLHTLQEGNLPSIPPAPIAPLKLPKQLVPKPQNVLIESRRRMLRLGTMAIASEDEISRLEMPVYETTEDRPQLVIGRKSWKKIILRTAAAMGLLLFITGGVVAWRGYTTASKVLSGTTTVAALSSKEITPQMLQGEGDGRVNVLLLGIGGANHDGGDLTDTMMIASIDPVNNTATLLSLPRDLWVKMPTKYYGQYQKINAAYSAGKYSYLGKTDLKNADTKAIAAGMTAVDTVVEQSLGVTIHYHVLINFEAFKQAVDTVGGVALNVKDPLVDASMAWENNNNPTLVSAGTQQLDGKTALMYARSRHTSSDFARSERQRELLLALKDKALSIGVLSNPLKIDGLVTAFGDNMYSDLSSTAALRLYDITKKMNNDAVRSIDLITAPHALVTTDRVGDISIVRPKLGLDAYSDIQKYVRGELRDGYLVKENASVVALGRTQNEADATKQTLESLGYNVGSSVVVANAPQQTTVYDVSLGMAPYTKNYLTNRYGQTVKTELPSGVTVPTGTQFAILIQK